jgi:hypothetical protein
MVADETAVERIFVCGEGDELSKEFVERVGDAFFVRIGNAAFDAGYHALEFVFEVDTAEVMGCGSVEDGFGEPGLDFGVFEVVAGWKWWVFDALVDLTAVGDHCFCHEVHGGDMLPPMVAENLSG